MVHTSFLLGLFLRDSWAILSFRDGLWFDCINQGNSILLQNILFRSVAMGGSYSVWGEDCRDFWEYSHSRLRAVNSHFSSLCLCFFWWPSYGHEESCSENKADAQRKAAPEDVEETEPEFWLHVLGICPLSRQPITLAKYNFLLVKPSTSAEILIDLGCRCSACCRAGLAKENSGRKTRI